MSQPKCKSSAARQALPVCDGHGRCFSLCVCVCVLVCRVSRRLFVGNSNVTHSLEAVQLIVFAFGMGGCCARGRAALTHTSSAQTTAQPRQRNTATAAVQQRRTSSGAIAAHQQRYISSTTAAVHSSIPLRQPRCFRASCVCSSSPGDSRNRDQPHFHVQFQNEAQHHRSSSCPVVHGVPGIPGA